MIEQPHFDSYSTAARICLGVAILGTALLIAILTSFIVH
jgi:hypothetical protein